MLFDGSSSHVAMAHRIPENIQLHRLPPDSPELNSVVNLWDERRCRCRQSAHHPIRASTLELGGSLGSISNRAGSLARVHAGGKSVLNRGDQLKPTYLCRTTNSTLPIRTKYTRFSPAPCSMPIRSRSVRMISLQEWSGWYPISHSTKMTMALMALPFYPPILSLGWY